MRPVTCLASLALLLSAPSSLKAQEPHFGFGLNLVFPTGDFHSKTYAPTATTSVPQTEAYDVGLGAQFTISFPVDPKLAFRLNFGAQSTEGTNTAPGLERLNLRHSMSTIGGELQFFTGSAYRHRGTYFLVGLSADFERFSSREGSWHDHDDWDDEGNVARKSRMGATFGIGHTLHHGGANRFTIELAFHKTISGNDVSSGEPPSTDFLKACFGWVF